MPSPAKKGIVVQSRKELNEDNDFMSLVNEYFKLSVNLFAQRLVICTASFVDRYI